MAGPESKSMVERIDGDKLLSDSAIISYGSAPYFRDYDVIVDVTTADPTGGSYIKGRYRFRFTHCVEATVQTIGTPNAWDDVFTDYAAWEAAGSPEGFVWGVNWAEAYPGMSYVKDSESAREWTEKLGHEMHEVLINTNTFDINLIFHDLRIDLLEKGTPGQKGLTPVPHQP